MKRTIVWLYVAVLPEQRGLSSPLWELSELGIVRSCQPRISGLEAVSKASPAGPGQRWATFLPLICCFWRFNLQLGVNFSPTWLESSWVCIFNSEWSVLNPVEDFKVPTFKPLMHVHSSKWDLLTRCRRAPKHKQGTGAKMFCTWNVCVLLGCGPLSRSRPPCSLVSGFKQRLEPLHCRRSLNVHSRFSKQCEQRSHWRILYSRLKCVCHGGLWCGISVTPAGLQAAGSMRGEQQLLLSSGALLNHISLLYTHRVQCTAHFVHIQTNVFIVTWFGRHSDHYNCHLNTFAGLSLTN